MAEGTKIYLLLGGKGNFSFLSEKTFHPYVPGLQTFAPFLCRWHSPATQNFKLQWDISITCKGHYGKHAMMTDSIHYCLCLILGIVHVLFFCSTPYAPEIHAKIQRIWVKSSSANSGAFDVIALSESWVWPIFHVIPPGGGPLGQTLMEKVMAWRTESLALE